MFKTDIESESFSLKAFIWNQVDRFMKLGEGGKIKEVHEMQERYIESQIKHHYIIIGDENE